jgi:uncharacterized protein (DUF2147 family)
MIRLLLVGLGVGLCLSATAQGGDEPIGEWERDDGGSRIEITRCGEDLCAVNRWIRDPDGDEKPGDRLVLSVRPTALGRFEGEAHDERRDMTYSMVLSVTPSGLQTEGCVLFGLLCRSASWTRIR